MHTRVSLDSIVVSLTLSQHCSSWQCYSRTCHLKTFLGPGSWAHAWAIPPHDPPQKLSLPGNVVKIPVALCAVVNTRFLVFPLVAGPSPIVEDMSAVLEFLQLWHAVEPNKGYPREPWVRGRVRVRLVDEDGIPWNPEVPDSEYVGRLDHKMPTPCSWQRKSQIRPSG